MSGKGRVPMRVMQFFRTIQLKLIIIYVLLILFAMQLIGIYFTKTMESSFSRAFSESLNSEASLLAGYLEMGEYLPPSQDSKGEDGKKTRADLNQFVLDWFKMINAEIQILDADGVVLSAYPSSQTIIDRKITQPVVSRALQNMKDKENEQTITDVDGKRKKVIARPVVSNGKVVGAVYIVKSMEEMYSTVARINRIFLTGTIIALAMTALLGVVLSQTITGPIKEITKQATSVAEGRFDRQLKVYGMDEIGQLSNAFNYMTIRLQEALSINEEEREKLASILTNMNDGVLAANDLNQVIVINRRAKQMLQRTEEETIGQDLFDVLGVSRDPHPLDGEDADRTMLISIRLPEQEEDLQVRVSFMPIHRRDKGITGTIVVLQDVTEQEKLEQSRREFVANVSHELRTPLTTIKSYLEALGDGAMADPQLAERFLNVTRNETERMIRLVNDLLQLSRLDSEQFRLKKEWTNVSDMLEEVADRFSFQARQRHLKISLNVENNLGKVQLDRDQIDQVLDNLVSNSIKYTADGGRIVISAKQSEPNLVEISVADNGMGIPKKDLDRIFERFYRVDKARSRNMGGTGLGLSIAREIIRAHGGAIHLESEYNSGTRVAFTLPAYSEESGVPA